MRIASGWLFATLSFFSAASLNATTPVKCLAGLHALAGASPSEVRDSLPRLYSALLDSADFSRAELTRLAESPLDLSEHSGRSEAREVLEGIRSLLADLPPAERADRLADLSALAAERLSSSRERVEVSRAEAATTADAAKPLQHVVLTPSLGVRNVLFLANDGDRFVFGKVFRDQGYGKLSRIEGWRTPPLKGAMDVQEGLFVEANGKRGLHFAGKAEFSWFDFDTGRALDASERLPPPYPIDTVYGVQVSPDGKWVIYHREGARNRAWRTDTKRGRINDVELPSSVFLFRPRSAEVWGVSYDTLAAPENVVRFDMKTKELKPFTRIPRGPREPGDVKLSFSQDGGALTLLALGFGDEFHLRRFDVASGGVLDSHDGPLSGARIPMLVPGGSYFVRVTTDKDNHVVRFHSAKDGALVAQGEWKGDDVSLRFSPDGSRVAVATVKNSTVETISVYDVADWIRRGRAETSKR